MVELLFGSKSSSPHIKIENLKSVISLELYIVGDFYTSHLEALMMYFQSATEKWTTHIVLGKLEVMKFKKFVDATLVTCIPTENERILKNSDILKKIVRAIKKHQERS